MLRQWDINKSNVASVAQSNSKSQSLRQERKETLAGIHHFDVAAVHDLAGCFKPVLKTGLVQHMLWLATECAYALTNTSWLLSSRTLVFMVYTRI